MNLLFAILVAPAAMLPAVQVPNLRQCAPLVIFAQAAGGGGFFSEFRKAFNNVAEEIAKKVVNGGQDAPAARMAPRAVANPQQLNAKDAEDRKRRLQTHAAAFEQWIATEVDLEEQQRAAVQEIVTAAIAAPPEAGNGRSQLVDFCPIVFANPDGAAHLFYHFKLLKNIQEHLSEDQQSVLQRAIDERKQFIRQSFLASIVATIDRDLYLTSETRKAFSEALEPRLKELFSGLYAFNAQPHYLDYASLNAALTQQVLSILNSDAQRERARQISANQGQPYIHIQSTEEVSQWYERMDKAIVLQQNQLACAAAVRAAYYESELGLTPAQSRKLTVAGKGATTTMMSSWKKQSIQQLQNWEERLGRMNGNFGFALAYVDVNRIDNDRIWKHTINSLSVEIQQQSRRRDQMNRMGVAQGMLGFLDKELWLRTGQRKPMIQLVRAAMPKSIKTSYVYLHDLLIFAAVVNNLKEDDLKGLLDEPQMSAWSEMKKMVALNNNTIQIRTRQNNNFQMNVPQ